jgi:hypothetical protein
MDDLLAARHAILTAAKADVALTALVPAARIYTQASPVSSPVWPFIIYGSPSGLPIRAACVNGTEVTVALHSFAHPRRQNPGDPKSAVLEPAEDYAARIGAAVVAALDGKRPTLPSGGYLAIRFTGSQLLIDGGEKDAFHHVANFRCRAITS